MYDLIGPSDLHDPRFTTISNPHISSYTLLFPAIHSFLVRSLRIRVGQGPLVYLGTIPHVLYTCIERVEHERMSDVP